MPSKALQNAPKGTFDLHSATICDFVYFGVAVLHRLYCSRLPGYIITCNSGLMEDSAGGNLRTYRFTWKIVKVFLSCAKLNPSLAPLISTSSAANWMEEYSSWCSFVSVKSLLENEQFHV